MIRRVAPLLSLLVLAVPAGAQQMGDPEFAPAAVEPRWREGEGPRVAIDAAHDNFHTLDGRYAPFAAVLAADGFRVRGNDVPFTPEALAAVDLLVVANALHPDNEGNWKLPTPSAFTPEEIAFVRAWVEEGGALFLIADHMPFPGAAEDLAAAFGFTLHNGFALPAGDPSVPIRFRREDGTLGDHDAARGVDEVRSFTGQAFRAPDEATVILRLPEGTVSLDPEIAWEFDDDTPHVDVGGWAQGAVLPVGKGRVAVFGEAAMFSSQVAGDRRVGLRSEGAEGNETLLHGLTRWLVGG